MHQSIPVQSHIRVHNVQPDMHTCATLSIMMSDVNIPVVFHIALERQLTLLCAVYLRLGIAMQLHV